MGELDELIRELQAVLDKLDRENQQSAAIHVAQAIEILIIQRNQHSADKLDQD